MILVSFVVVLVYCFLCFCIWCLSLCLNVLCVFLYVLPWGIINDDDDNNNMPDRPVTKASWRETPLDSFPPAKDRSLQWGDWRGTVNNNWIVLLSCWLEQSEAGDGSTLGTLMSRYREEIAQRNLTSSKRGRCSLDIFCVHEAAPSSRRRRKHLRLL